MRDRVVVVVAVYGVVVVCRAGVRHWRGFPCAAFVWPVSGHRGICFRLLAVPGSSCLRNAFFLTFHRFLFDERRSPAAIVARRRRFSIARTPGRCR
uniref:Uncharacterized protein n=1 Tax=Anopheles darlingi TaxID=43151 RepID=A0A2M4DMC8_ANODA